MKTSNKVPRFFINQDITDLDRIIISDLDINHQIKNVLRLRSGDSIILLDNLGNLFLGQIETISKKKFIVSKIKIDFFNRDKKISVNIVPAILKKNNLEFVFQKCTEIGVAAFHPIISERTEKMKLNHNRSKKIIKEASEQSEKIFMPELLEVKLLEIFLSDLVEKQNGDTQNIFVLEFGSEKIKIADFKKMSGEIFFLIGPEGGWGEIDLKIFEKFNLRKTTLGDQTLKAETASVSASALLLLGE